MVRELREITEEEFLNATPFNLAIRFGYHPCGYGMYGAKKYEENGKYYFYWERFSSCD